MPLLDNNNMTSPTQPHQNVKKPPQHHMKGKQACSYRSALHAQLESFPEMLTDFQIRKSNKNPKEVGKHIINSLL